MLRAVREGGNVVMGAAHLLALAGIEHPTPEQSAGAMRIDLALRDLHLLARAHTKEG